MQDNLDVPATELPNPASSGIDSKSARAVVQIIHAEDRRAWEAVGKATDEIARVVDYVAEAFRVGGRLIYIGAGTSGRLGVLDAAECPPTFGVASDLVCAVIAGGEAALRQAVEGAEDSVELGRQAIVNLSVREGDVVCGIAASGTTPFVWGALEEASIRDVATVLITCNPAWETHSQAKLVDFVIVAPTGPEIVAGSTRMKAGTATKLILNTISTASMIRWGKVYGNLMVDVRPVNAKLRRRAARLVSSLGHVDLDRAMELLEAAGNEVKTAIVAARLGIDSNLARARLGRHRGLLRETLEDTDPRDEDAGL
jgi:N-acetylmuramic acid 6-phosphate etherase